MHILCMAKSHTSEDPDKLRSEETIVNGRCFFVDSKLKAYGSNAETVLTLKPQHLCSSIATACSSANLLQAARKWQKAIVFRRNS